MFHLFYTNYYSELNVSELIFSKLKRISMHLTIFYRSYKMGDGRKNSLNSNFLSIRIFNIMFLLMRKTLMVNYHLLCYIMSSKIRSM